MFPVRRVDSRRAEELEPLGTKRKFWYTDDAGRRMLFKAEERGTGEDWAEKIACELCRLLGMPHVHYELAIESEAWRAFSRQSPTASTIWIDRLRSIDEDTLGSLLAETPPNRLSKIGRDFTRQLLIENRRRILAGDDT